MSPRNAHLLVGLLNAAAAGFLLALALGWYRLGRGFRIAMGVGAFVTGALALRDFLG